MTREELEQEVRARMSGEHEPQTVEEDVCEHCGSIVEKDPYTQMIPEHGGDTEYRVVWCDEKCKSNWIQESL
jgi:hypothetical protein